MLQRHSLALPPPRQHVDGVAAVNHGVADWHVVAPGESLRQDVGCHDERTSALKLVGGIAELALIVVKCGKGGVFVGINQIPSFDNFFKVMSNNLVLMQTEALDTGRSIALITGQMNRLATAFSAVAIQDDYL